MVQHFRVNFIKSDLVGIELVPQFTSSFPSLFLKLCNNVAKRYGEQFLLNSQHYPVGNDSAGLEKSVDTDYLMQNLIERYARAWSSTERKQIRSHLDRMVELNESVLETTPKNEAGILDLYERVLSYPEKQRK